MDTFTLRIASKRQATIPARLLKLLHLDEGDVLELTVDRGTITSGRGLKLVPTSLFTTEVLEELRKREKSLDMGEAIELKTIDQLAEKN